MATVKTKIISSSSDKEFSEIEEFEIKSMVVKNNDIEYKVDENILKSNEEILEAIQKDMQNIMGVKRVYSSDLSTGTYTKGNASSVDFGKEYESEWEIEDYFEKIRNLEKKRKRSKPICIDHKKTVSTLLKSISKDIKDGKIKEKDVEIIAETVEEWLLTIDRKEVIIEKIDEFGFIFFDKK